MFLCSATFECGDLLSYLGACTMPCGLGIRLALLPFVVAVCVLLSIRNETLCVCPFAIVGCSGVGTMSFKA